MSKKYIVIILVLLVLVLAVGGYYWKTKMQKSDVNVNENVSKEDSLSVSTNPLDNKPNINPIDQTNPFKNIKTNPFE